MCLHNRLWLLLDPFCIEFCWLSNHSMSSNLYSELKSNLTAWCLHKHIQNSEQLELFEVGFCNVQYMRFNIDFVLLHCSNLYCFHISSFFNMLKQMLRQYKFEQFISFLQDDIHSQVLQCCSELWLNSLLLTDEQCALFSCLAKINQDFIINRQFDYIRLRLRLYQNNQSNCCNFVFGSVLLRLFLKYFIQKSHSHNMYWRMFWLFSSYLHKSVNSFNLCIESLSKDFKLTNKWMLCILLIVQLFFQFSIWINSISVFSQRVLHHTTELSHILIIYMMYLRTHNLFECSTVIVINSIKQKMKFHSKCCSGWLFLCMFNRHCMSSQRMSSL